MLIVYFCCLCVHCSYVPLHYPFYSQVSTESAAHALVLQIRAPTVNRFMLQPGVNGCVWFLGIAERWGGRGGAALFFNILGEALPMCSSI